MKIGDRVIAFDIEGEAKGKGRPRRTNNGHVYTPTNTGNYENWVRDRFLASGQEPLIGKVPIAASITVYTAIPKSTPKKLRAKMESGEVRPIKKPDCDNIIKSILDSLNGIAYADDCQIVTLAYEKAYSEMPKVSVKLWEMVEGE